MSNQYPGSMPIDPLTMAGIAVSGFTSGLKDGFNNQSGPSGNTGLKLLTPAFAYASLPKHVRRAMAQERDMIEKFANKFYSAGINCAYTIKHALGF